MKIQYDNFAGLYYVWSVRTYFPCPNDRDAGTCNADYLALFSSREKARQWKNENKRYDRKLIITQEYIS